MLQPDLFQTCILLHGSLDPLSNLEIHHLSADLCLKLVLLQERHPRPQRLAGPLRGAHGQASSRVYSYIRKPGPGTSPSLAGPRCTAHRRNHALNAQLDCAGGRSLAAAAAPAHCRHRQPDHPPGTRVLRCLAQVRNRAWNHGPSARSRECVARPHLAASGPDVPPARSSSSKVCVKRCWYCARVQRWLQAPIEARQRWACCAARRAPCKQRRQHVRSPRSSRQPIGQSCKAVKHHTKC